MRCLARVLLVGGALLVSCSDGGEKIATPPVVKYQTATRPNENRIRAFSGITQSGVESKLSFRVPGAIAQLPVKVGGKVQRGEIIARLDSKDYALKVQQAEASLLQSEAQERHAAASYVRIRELYETHSTSRNELDASRAEAESASAAVEAMQKKLELSRLQLSYTQLKAPLDGDIATVSTEVSENVGVGQPVVILNSGERLEVKVSIPELLIVEIEKGKQVKVSFDAIPDEYFRGEVSEVGVPGKSVTTFPVIIELLEYPEGIRPGMTAEVFFQFGGRDFGRQVYLPSWAVVEQGGKHYALVVKSVDDIHGIVEKRVVSVGQLTNEGIEITSGVAEGEKIVTAGIHLLEDGQKVRLIRD